MKITKWVIKSEKGFYETEKIGVYSKSLNKAFLYNTKESAKHNYNPFYGEKIERVILEIVK